jgi:small subunit ribosomal protein S17
MEQEAMPTPTGPTAPGPTSTGGEQEVVPARPARGRRQTKVGTVVSNKMAKTVVVTVTSTVMHPLYRRYIKRTSRFYAHDEAGACQVGDEVLIVSTRPLSRLKRWRVGEILKRAE